MALEPGSRDALTFGICEELGPRQMSLLSRFFRRFAQEGLGVGMVDFVCALRGVLGPAIRRRAARRSAAIARAKLLHKSWPRLRRVSKAEVAASAAFGTPAGTGASASAGTGTGTAAAANPNDQHAATEEVLRSFAAEAIELFRRVDVDGAGVAQWGALVSALLETRAEGVAGAIGEAEDEALAAPPVPWAPSDRVAPRTCRGRSKLDAPGLRHHGGATSAWSRCWRSPRPPRMSGR